VAIGAGTVERGSESSEELRVVSIAQGRSCWTTTRSPGTSG